MTITKESKTFRTLTGHTLKDQSFSRMFNILVDHDRTTRFMNIFKSYTFNSDLDYAVSFYTTHEVGDNEWWDNISQRYYRTPYFWWVVASFNGVINPFEGPISGTNLKILKPAYIYSLLRDLDSISAT
jgi:hypothetical protein